MTCKTNCDCPPKNVTSTIPVVGLEGGKESKTIGATTDEVKLVIIKELLRKLDSKGWPDSDIKNILTIIFMESKFNPSAANGANKGLGQISLLALTGALYQVYRKEPRYETTSDIGIETAAKAAASEYNLADYDSNLDATIIYYSFVKHRRAGNSSDLEAIYARYVEPFSKKAFENVLERQGAEAVENYNNCKDVFSKVDVRDPLSILNAINNNYPGASKKTYTGSEYISMLANAYGVPGDVDPKGNEELAKRYDDLIVKGNNVTDDDWAAFNKLVDNWINSGGEYPIPKCDCDPSCNCGDNPDTISPPTAPQSKASPIILDLNGDGVKTVAVEDGVHFDHDSNRFAEKSGWTNPDDGFLVWDRNSNGQIDDGAELFGNNYILSNGNNAANGFEALAEFDSNGDGLVNQKDERWSELMIWQDRNGNGQVEVWELLTMEEAGIAGLYTISQNHNYTDENGNEHRQIGSFIREDGSVGQMADVWFQTELADTKYLG